MVSDGYAYKTGIMRYLKDDQSTIKVGKLPDANKRKIVSSVDVVWQNKNGFDFGVFACMFEYFISNDHPLSFIQYDTTNQ